MDERSGESAAAPATCPAAAVQPPLCRTDADEQSALLKAVADPTRLQLLSVIRAATGQAVCVCDLTAAVGLSQPTVSHHLKILTEAGILTRESRGRWAWFSLDSERLARVRAILD